jgi:hypothetical protein
MLVWKRRGDGDASSPSRVEGGQGHGRSGRRSARPDVRQALTSVARYEIEVLPWAIDDAREAYLHLERDERLADEFQRRVTEALRSLAETAHHYQAREDSIRRCPLKKFPHGIMYGLEEGRVIYAVAHPKRQPGFWTKR